MAREDVVDALRRALADADVDYPASRTEILDAAGDRTVELGSRSFTVRRLLDQAPDGVYGSAGDVADAVRERLPALAGDETPTTGRDATSAGTLPEPATETEAPTPWVEDLRRHLEDVRFPASRDELIGKLGRESVRTAEGSVTFQDMLARVPDARFESEDDLVGRVMDVVGELEGR